MEAEISTFTISDMPTNVQLDISENNISITWDTITDADYYALRIFCNDNKISAKIADTNSIIISKSEIIESFNFIHYTDIDFRISANIDMVPGLESSDIWTPDPTNLLFCKTYDDAIVSGVAKIIRLQDEFGDYKYIKVYPSISATINETIDNIGENLYGIDDTVLSGLAEVVGLKSSDSFNFLKVYPTVSTELNIITGVNITLNCISDAILSGTSRVAEVQLNGVNYYLKVYPTKS